MTWGDWMVVNFSIEEELQIESQSRSVFNCKDSSEVARLCSALVKQNAYYQKLLRQATGHIAKLELEAFLTEEAKLQCESDGLDQSRQDDTQDRNPFLEPLLIVLSFVVSCVFAVQRLWRQVKPAKNPTIHD
jgi:hypothetical protein